MLSNAQLAIFQALVDDELAAGRSGDAALEGLKGKLDDCVVSSSELAFDTWESEVALPNHVLLAHTDMLSMFRSFVYSHIAGGGRHYNGMYGDGQLLRDTDACFDLLKSDREPAPIAEQVSLCLRVLDSGLGSIHPEIVKATRRHLGTILLNYPVLMHPAFVIPVHRASGNEYVSISHALASCLNGALPRLSDLVADGEDDAPIRARLAAFANHPCTRLALTKTAMRVYSSAAKPSGRRGKPKFAKESLAKAIFGRTGSHAGFLASVMELEDMSGRATDAVPFSSTTQSIHLRTPLQVTMGLAAFGAMGIAHTGPVGSIPQEQLRYPKDAGYLAHLKRRLTALQWHRQGEAFAQGFLGAIQRRIFLGSRGGASVPLPVDVMLHNLRSVVSGMVECGMADDKSAAAQLVLQWSLGAKRPSTNLPAFDTVTASAFLCAMEELGGFGWNALELPKRMQELLDDVLSVPARPMPFKDDWANVLRAMVAERSMKAVLRRAGTGAEVASSRVSAAGGASGSCGQAELDFAAPVQDLPAPRRRARAGV